ncbi:uncharacterized protein LOC132205196 [Neocloeon triangulifer]|uniref:uncharacterized protein LOC132205196 n=1 Tax=Neocloeon triangulifer TaxID=2078957 RepID=UPI00286F7DD8|nr:uncharacterized protein LOC132205196 [Neocloeon triangulifer]
MSLLSLDGQYKYEALRNISTSNEMKTEAQNLTFWTSGSDEGCESVFGFCSANRLFRSESMWLPGQPDNAGGNENYVAAHIWREKGQLLLADYDGRTKFRYICEKRRNPQSKNEKQTIVDECSLIYKVTTTEIDLLRNTTKWDLRMKCFIQCAGDALGLIVGGRFVESKVFAILETMSLQNVDELIKNMAIMDECNNKTYGMDECDKAYRLTKCARDKAPQVFDQIIKDLDKQAAERDELFSTSSGCVSNTTCIVNETVKNDLFSLHLKMNVSTCADYINGTWVCKCNDSKLILISYRNSNYYTFADAVRLCCYFGLRLLSPFNYVNATNCYELPLIQSTYANRSWTYANALVVDTASGLVRDCESGRDFYPQNLKPSHRMIFDTNNVLSGGTLVAFYSLNSGSPEYSAMGSNHLNSFICES